MVAGAPSIAEAPSPSESTGTWGLLEAALAWIASNIVAGILLAFVFSQGDFTTFVSERPGGHIGRTAGQLATDQELVDRALPLVWQLLLLFPGWAVLLGVSWLFAGALGRDRPGWSLKTEYSDIPLGVLSGLFLQIPILVIVVTFMQLIFGPFEPSGRALALVDSADSPLLVLLLIFAVAIGAPIVEELFYRGIVQPALIRLTNVPIGIGLASVLFGAVHFSLVELIPLSVVGLVFGLLAHKTGRVAPAILAHMAFNSFTLVLLLFA